VLDLEGLWTRYEDPEPLLQEIRELEDEAATKRLQEIYAAPIQEELIGRRIEEIRSAGLVTAARLSPQHTAQYHRTVVDAALHLMRTGAAGVLVGFGGGSGHTTRSVLGVAVPMASAIGDVAAARRDYLDESGGRYVHVIADGGMTSSGDIAKSLACGADAV